MFTVPPAAAAAAAIHLVVLLASSLVFSTVLAHSIPHGIGIVTCMHAGTRKQKIHSGLCVTVWMCDHTASVGTERMFQQKQGDGMRSGTTSNEAT